MIGFSGAHRTGKTTLAKEVAEHFDVPFAGSPASNVFAEMGLCPKADYPIEKRLEIQRRLLDECHKTWVGAGHVFVSDRTPLDLMAYTMSAVTREVVDEKANRELERYISDCFDVANQCFHTILVVQPGITPVEAQGKGPTAYGYTEHVAALTIGYLYSERLQANRFWLPKDVTNLKTRIEKSVACITKTMVRDGLMIPPVIFARRVVLH